MAVTFAGNETVGSLPQAIFIDTSNTVYTANYQHGTIQIWLGGSSIPTDTIFTNSSDLKAIFIAGEGDIYITNAHPYFSVDVWRKNSSSRLSRLSVSEPCFGVFIDANNSLLCAFYYTNRVIKRSLNISDNQLTTVAGGSCAGYQPHLLASPFGVFVTVHFDLYVADNGNHRVQLFRSGQLNGTTVAGSGAPGTMQLRHPAEVMLDFDGRIFILDSYNSRIVRSGSDGFQCIIGCSVGYGSAAYQLSYPRSMSFDTDGNIFVADFNNNRVQKFLLVSNTCSKYNAAD